MATIGNPESRYSFTVPISYAGGRRYLGSVFNSARCLFQPMEVPEVDEEPGAEVPLIDTLS